MSTSVLGGVSVVYKLRAEAVRSAFSQNLHAVVSIPIIRSFAPEALEYQQSLEIENTWPDKLMYSIMVPHKAWAAGDKLTAVVKFAPLAKGVCVLNVMSTIHEQTKIFARVGTQEHTRIVAVAKYEIVGGKPVEVRGTRLLRSYAAGNHTPPTPPSPAPEFLHSHHTNSSHSSGIGRPHLSSSSSTSSPSTPPSDLTASGTGPSSSIFDNADDGDNSDIVAHINIDIPTTITPSHALEPVTVTHRVRWNILILNRDGHTSELRCSLPLHLLDYRLLDEARSYTAATRRLLLGGPEEPIEEPEEVQLPSYMAHVRDRVANMFLPDASTMRVRNPWIVQGVSPTINAELLVRSGHSTPLEAHAFSHLPHAPRSGSDSPLDWVDSELLLSLSQDHPVHADLQHMNSPTDPPSVPHSRPSSRNRGTSRFSSRSASPDHDRELHAFTQIPVSSPHETYVHTGNASRRLHSILNASMKPFSSFSNHWMHQIHHLAPSSHSSTSDVQRPTPSRSTSVLSGPDPNSGAALLHRAFTEVPDYSIAARGFLGGVPPLSSLSGLPSYEETQRT
jgi:arrestin-related trafficking adapter 4/5/7